MTIDTKKPAAKKTRSLHEASLAVLKESALGPGVAHQDPPQKLSPTDGPARGAIVDAQNTNNVNPANIGKQTGADADNKSMDGGTKKLTPADGGLEFDANQDLGASLTNAEDDTPPSAKGVVGGRTAKVPGGNYPAQDKFNPTGKKIFAEGDDDEKDDGDKKSNPFAKIAKKDDEDGDDDKDSDKDSDDDDDKDDEKCEEVEEEQVQEALVPEAVIQSSYDSINMDEHFAAILSNGGDKLSEEFKERTKTVFEAAVLEAAKAMFETLNGYYTVALTEATTRFENSLTEQVDDYLGYVVEQWVAENEVAIESGLRTELTEDVISGIRKVFIENNIDVPETKVDVVEALTDQVAELEAKLNEEFENAVRLRKELAEQNKAQIFGNVSRGLTDVQMDKLKGLSESIVFTEAAEYETKLQTLKESYLSGGVRTPAVTNTKMLDSVEPTVTSDGKTLTEEKETKELTPRMAAYTSALGRQVKSPTYKTASK